uniref:C-type lectin domain-containing protein n=1 Tax=Equus asinus TaxID=9793 RepID=A0A9L0ISW1_EQUAS
SPVFKWLWGWGGQSGNELWRLRDPGLRLCEFLWEGRFIVFFCPGLQYTCLNRYRGFLVSIHSFTSNYRIQRLARSVNQGQIWIGGAARGSGRCRSFYWLDGSAWNFWLWARGEPSASGGNCVSMYTQGPLGEQRRGRNPGLFTL